jgi:hypothetical protein
MRLLRSVGAFVALGACLFVWSSPARATDYPTFHWDNARDGWNPGEGSIFPGRIPGHFVQIGSTIALNGSVEAQPVYMHKNSIFGGAPNGWVFVATNNDYVYAFLARSGSSTPVWSRQYGTPVNHSWDGNCGDTGPNIGIQSTPVVDTAAGILYFVAYTIDTGAPNYYLHAVSTTTGNDVLTPTLINPPGFNPTIHRQRAALVQANGNIYVSFASFCDFYGNATFGQVMSFSTSNLALQNRYITTNYGGSCANYNNIYLGTIWGSGFGPAVDASGNLYFTTGNGCIAYGNVNNGAFSQAVLKLTPSLQLLNNTSAMFAPCNAVSESQQDLDLGSGGVSLMPDQTGSYPHLMVAGGKTGVTFVLNRDNLGGWSCPDQIPNEIGSSSGLYGGHAVFTASNGATYVAVGGQGSLGMRSYLVNANGTLSLAGAAGGTLSGVGGTSPIVTSNGTQAGTYTLWYLSRPPGDSGTMNLVAYDAENLGGGAVLNQPIGSWGSGTGIPFHSPTVVDGMVFVATNAQLQIWTINGIRW